MVFTLLFSNLLLVMLIGYAIIIKLDKRFERKALWFIIAYVFYLAIYMSVFMVGPDVDQHTLVSIQASGQKIAIIAGFLCLGTLAHSTRRRVGVGDLTK